MRAFRLGRLFGIELRIDWSWLLILVLLVWNLNAVFWQWHPEWSLMATFAVAVTAALLFFGCVLLHELAHSLVAQAYGVPVRSITLFLFGGISNIEREPPSPMAEFLTAIVGPATSIALGLGFSFVAAVVTPLPSALDTTEDTVAALSQLGPLTTLLVWLGPINVIIGLFNLIPGFPLDGGRVLRSAFWAATRNFQTATRWASWTGQVIGWAFIAMGIAMIFGARIPLFGTGLASGIWLAFIGWFLNSAAAQTSTRLALDEVMAGMTVEQLMRKDTNVASPDMTVASLVYEHFIRGEDRALPVVKQGALVGLVSFADVRTVAPEKWAITPVGAVMRRRDAVKVVSPADPLVTAFEQLAREDIGQLPVVVGGTVVGMLRRRDIARWLELAWRPPTPGVVAKPQTPVVEERAADVGPHDHGAHPAT